MLRLSNEAKKNKITQEQYGDDNIAKAKQEGYSNTITQYQSGDDNNAFTTQLGDRNKISESQFETETILDFQNGCDNSIKVYQSSGGSYNTPPVNLPTPKCPSRSTRMLTKIKLKTKNHLS